MKTNNTTVHLIFTEGGVVEKVPVGPTDERSAYLTSHVHFPLPFLRPLFALLSEANSSSAGPAVRGSCLKTLLRIVHFLPPEALAKALKPQAVSNNLASMLGSSDLKIVVGSFQLCSLLMEKLKDEFCIHFRREGVFHQISRISVSEVVGPSPMKGEPPTTATTSSPLAPPLPSSSGPVAAGSMPLLPTASLPLMNVVSVPSALIPPPPPLTPLHHQAPTTSGSSPYSICLGGFFVQQQQQPPPPPPPLPPSSNNNANNAAGEFGLLGALNNVEREIINVQPSSGGNLLAGPSTSSSALTTLMKCELSPVVEVTAGGSRSGISSSAAVLDGSSSSSKKCALEDPPAQA
jgi:hypothetical protein